jgi:hypothetical protein
VLSQWVGTWSYTSPALQFERTCNWAGTFVACTSDGQLTLLGYEPTNRRYIMWEFDDAGVTTYAGTAGATAWNLELGPTHITWTRTSPTTWAQHAEINGHGADGVWTAATPPGPPPSAPPARPAATVDWRAELQGLVGTWTFTGTLAGQPLTYTEACEWLPASTFVFCKNDALKQFSLTGWQPQTQELASYGISHGIEGGQLHVLPGKVDNHNWSFTDGKTTLTMTRVSPLEYTLRGTAPDGQTFEGSYKTNPE